MSNPSSNPASSQTPHQEKAADTSGNALEATGSNPVPDSGTVASNHPNAPHPVAAGELPRIAGYAIVRKLGEGGMGAVYLAEDEQLHRKVAIKTMRREFAANKLDRERFLREARAAAAIEHDNIVPIWGLGEAADGTPFIAMPLLQGEMLDARLKREPVSPADLILKVAGEVAEGLAAAHAKGLIHRDIKPANVWLEGDSHSVRRCKVLDFGLARSVDKDDAQLTASGAILGTPAYMAPEQARGEKVDHRADLFSLGVTLYRMATGRLPFDGPTAMAVLIALTTEMPPPVRQIAPGLPPELAKLIDRLMSKDRTARPQSAAEVAKAVRAIGATMQAAVSDPISTSAPQVLAEEIDEAQAPGAKPRSSWLPWLIAAGCLLALAAGGLGLRAVLKESPDSGIAKNEATPKQADPPKADPDPDAKKTPEPKKDPPQEVKKDTEIKKGPEPKKEPKPEVKKEPEPVLDADRKAALAVLALPNAEGIVGVNEEGEPGDVVKEIKKAKDLPKRPFRLTAVSVLPKLDKNMKLLSAQNADLAVFKDCTNIKSLYLAGYDISNEGLAHFSNCKELKGLYLSGTKVNDGAAATIKQFTKLEDLILGATDFTDKGVMESAAALTGCRIQFGYTIEPATDADRKAAEYVLSNEGGRVRVNFERVFIDDAKGLPKELFRLTAVDLDDTRVGDAGLAHFKDCKTLTTLSLSRTQVTDAGLTHFKDCKTLTVLSLVGTKVSDVGLAHFKDCKSLTILSLTSTRLTDAGLVNFKDCKNLTKLHLINTQVTDAGLVNFKDCKSLTQLDLSHTDVSDKGLKQIKQLTKLESLYLAKTKVTVEGVADFSKALPKCEIVWDGGTINPKEK